MCKLVEKRKFVILTGAPGVGKTRLSKIVGESLGAKVFFTQFHAETDYSDFVYGIVPSLDEDSLGYHRNLGHFHNRTKIRKRKSGHKDNIDH